MTKVSLLTLVRGRDDHLERMLRGCLAQTHQPDEIVVALMQDRAPRISAELASACRFVQVEGGRLPLSRARNAAARAAGGDLLLFLDVDCIPGPDLVGSAVRHAGDGLCLTGDCRYLGPEETEPGTFDALWTRAERHPARLDGEAVGEPVTLSSVEELWSLLFALPRGLFDRVGGFDEAFDGYGGEDTDFARRLGLAGAKLLFVPRMRAVHQWHQVSIPPLQHFEDIVRNAKLFRERHGVWCMDYWLGQLAGEGYVLWEEDRLKVLREPSAGELMAARQPRHVRFS